MIHQRPVAATNIAIHVGGLRYFCCPKENIHSDSFCHVAADGNRLQRIFLQKSRLTFSRTFLQIEPASLGFDPVFYPNYEYLFFVDVSHNK